MNQLHDPEFSRNYGFWNEDAQQALFDSRVAIAGVGGDGFQLGVRLAMLGVQTFDVADPEVFEPENANRVPGATRDNYGRSKADAFREAVHAFNPDADIRTFKEGVNAQNIGEFMCRATLVFDETELTHLELGTMVSDEARRCKIPDIMVMNVGFAGQVTSFDPEGDYSFRTLMGIPEDMPLDEVAKQKLDMSRCLPYVPPYVHKNTLVTVQTDENAPLPSIATGVDVAAALGQAEALKHIFGKVDPRWEKPTWAPHMRYMDALTGASGVTRFPQMSFMRTAMHMAGRTKLGMNPDTSFTAADRERREAARAAVEVDRPQETVGRHRA